MDEGESGRHFRLARRLSPYHLDAAHRPNTDASGRGPAVRQRESRPLTTSLAGCPFFSYFAVSLCFSTGPRAC